MLQLAIVDDSPHDREAVRAYIEQYFEQNADFEQPQLCEYESGEDFLLEFAPKRFDIVVLDIYMGGITGFETAQRIRELDRSVCILFLTTSMEHVFMGYSVQAVQYVPKPLADHAELFATGLAACMERLVPDDAVLAVHLGRSAVSIPLRDILYADCQLRDACLHLADGRELNVKESIGEVCGALLADKRFLECHRNTVINMEHIRTMYGEDFQLKNGVRVPFAQRRKAELHRVYMDYFIELGGNG